jgi:hypothetical protein
MLTSKPFGAIQLSALHSLLLGACVSSGTATPLPSPTTTVPAPRPSPTFIRVQPLTPQILGVTPAASPGIYPFRTMN